MGSNILIGGNEYKGMSDLKIVRQSDKVVMCWRKPGSFTVDDAYDQKEQKTSNELGEETLAGRTTRGVMSTITIGYPGLTPEMIAFRSGGNQLETGSFTTSYPRTEKVEKGEYAGASASDIFGHGSPADPGMDGLSRKAYASISKNNISTPLTQQLYANYETWRATPMSFAIGANGARRYSDDLVAANEVVALDIPITATSQRISDLIVGGVTVSAKVVDNDNKIHLFKAFSAIIDLSSANVDFKADNVEVKLSLIEAPPECRLWQMYATGQRVACNA